MLKLCGLLQFQVKIISYIWSEFLSEYIIKS